MPTMTITTDAAQAQRLVTALGHKLSLGRDATAVEAKEYVKDVLRSVVLEYEGEIARRQISLNTFDPS